MEQYKQELDVYKRQKVGVVLPEQDGLAKKAVSMLGSLDLSLIHI